MVRCKFKVSEKNQIGIRSSEGDVPYRFKFSPVMSDGFGKYTPSATFEVLIQNDAASSQLEVGKEYYVDITPVETEVIPTSECPKSECV